MGIGFASQLLDVLGKTALQVAVLASVVLLVCRLTKEGPASFRYALWVLVLVKFLLPPMLNFPSQWAFWVTSEQSSAVVNVAPSSQMPMQTSYMPTGSSEVHVDPRHNFPSVNDIVVGLWMLGALGMLGMLFMRLSKQRNALVESTECDGRIYDLVDSAAHSLSLRKLPRLRASEIVRTPTLVGLIRPSIILPAQVVSSCSNDEIRAMLLHELAHIKRRDMATLWLYEIAKVLFFFHPVVWIAGRELEIERELACDELVVGVSSISATDYAAGYITALRLARRSEAMRVSLGMAEPFEVGKRRLEMILRSDIPKLSIGWLAAMAAVAIIGLPTFARVAPRSTSSVSSKSTVMDTAKKNVEAVHFNTAKEQKSEHIRINPNNENTRKIKPTSIQKVTLHINTAHQRAARAVAPANNVAPRTRAVEETHSASPNDQPQTVQMPAFQAEPNQATSPVNSEPAEQRISHEFTDSHSENSSIRAQQRVDIDMEAINKGNQEKQPN